MLFHAKVTGIDRNTVYHAVLIVDNHSLNIHSIEYDDNLNQLGLE